MKLLSFCSPFTIQKYKFDQKIKVIFNKLPKRSEINQEKGVVVFPVVVFTEHFYCVLIKLF